MRRAAVACLVAALTVVSGCGGAHVTSVDRVDTSLQQLSGPQLYVSPHGADGGPCTRAHPCRQLARADALATPGTTINVAPGRYAPAVLKTSGRPAARIRFRSTRRWQASLVNTGSATGPILLVDGSYVDVQGFEVTSDVPANVDGIALAGTGSRAIGNLVHDLRRGCASNGGIVAGDDAYAAHGMAIIGNYVHDIGSGPRDGSCSLLHGIYAAVPGVLIANNVVTRALGDGITSWHAASRLKIINNTVVGNGGNGILIGSGDAGATGKGNTGTVVANNVVAFNAGDAISETGPHPVRNMFVANSLHGNGRDTLNQWGDSRELDTLTGDPGFVDAPMDDFRLRAHSPDLRSGSAFSAATSDFLGAARRGAIARGAFQTPGPGS